MLLISIVHFLSSHNIMKLCNIVISMQVVMNNYLNLLISLLANQTFKVCIDFDLN